MKPSYLAEDVCGYHNSMYERIVSTDTFWKRWWFAIQHWWNGWNVEFVSHYNSNYVFRATISDEHYNGRPTYD